MPSMIFPIEKICSILRKTEIIIAVDGAHSVGAFDLDIFKIGKFIFFLKIYLNFLRLRHFLV